eukprot:TRINITY_DN95_c0_g1_i3.p1 TRINITY_DN95_c0_g1~~TRINITY_DN95_c0_g1_i3.p1  ORF type:complete len:437 (+),score=152.52 TRINITY_DN95_c0_g1_i3:101-1411(+)
MMALALKGLGVEGKSSKDKSRTKSERMSKKMAKEDQMYRRKLSLSKVKVASSPTNSTPSSSPSSSNTSSLAADIDAQGSIISEKPVLILPGITSQSKPPVPNSPAVASSSSSAASSSSSSAVHPLSSLPQMSLARRNSRIQLTPTNSINFGGSPRVRAVASPLTRARRGSIGSTSSSSPSLRPAGRTQIKFSIQFLRMHNERKQRRAEEQERKKAKDELQHKVLGNINLLEQRLAELRKMKEECKPGNVNEEQRIQAAQTILQQLEQVQCPTVSATTKSKNNRMEEEQARRLKKKMAADLISQQEAVNPGAGMIRATEVYAQLERQEQTIERELTKLRTQCVEANSRDAIMREEKLRREERLRLKSLERRNSSSCSPRLRFANKPLPPIRKGLFVKAAEAAKIAAQEQQTPVALTRMGRLAAEKARREATRDQAVV